MPFWRAYYHLVWATKNREYLIVPKIEDRLFAYLVKKAAELDVCVYAINGWYDHMHMIVAIPPKHSIVEVVKTLKGAGSHFLNHAEPIERHFAWQRGYGVLTLGERQRPIAEAYVINQKQHHRDNTVNTWLERESELDEGPSDVGIISESISPEIHEPGARYSTLGDLPF